jgi:phage portal protein BeeE
VGFISSLVEKSRRPVQQVSQVPQVSFKAAPSGPGERARAAWRHAFLNATNKEKGGGRQQEGGSATASAATGNNAVARLVQALRSAAPGGWSDDRWEQSRHFTGIAYVAIHRSSEQMGQSEFQVFVKDRKVPGGKRAVSEDDPPQGDRRCKPYDLVKLLEHPNGDDTWGDLMYNWNLQMDLTGMALTWMLPNRLGYPMELYPMPTAICVPQVVINPDYPHGFYRVQPIYPYGPFSSYPTPASAVGAPIPAQWMLKFKYPHPFLRYEGYSPLSALRLHLDEIEMMDRSRHYSMRRGVNPSAALQCLMEEGGDALNEPEIERIRAEFANDLMGPENAGVLHVGSPGWKLEPWGNRPVDMDYQAGWDQLTSFALGGLGVTKPAAGMVEDSSYSTLFATLKQLYWLTLEPKCNRFAGKLTRHLAPFFGDNLIVEIRTKRIDDHEVKNGKLTLLCQHKGMTVNELRQELDMPVTEEAWGKERVGDQPQQGGPGGPPQPGMGGEEPATMQPADADMEAANADMEAADGGALNLPEVEAERPTPGSLSRGALGPRKSIKSLAAIRARYRNVVGVNGNGRHV